MQILAYDDHSLPTDSFEVQNQRRPRQHRRASSCCGAPMSPDLRIECTSRESFSYEKLPNQILKLTIRKLDGSSFDVEVAEKATVADLKLEVEGVFRHMPREGPGEISWSHVWGHFCLSYDGWKLLADSEPINNYGISDGDQLHFVRCVSIDYNVTSRQSKDRFFASEQSGISDGHLENEENDVTSDDDGRENIMKRYELNVAQLWPQRFSYSRLENPGCRLESSSFSSIADGFWESFRSLIRFYSSNELNSQRDPFEEV